VERLAHRVEDQTAILTQLKFQDLDMPRNFETTAQTNTVQLQPVAPVHPFAFIPVEQLIRPTLKVQTSTIRSRPRVEICRPADQHRVSGEWTAYRQYTGIMPMYTVRFGLTLLFPHVLL
jgi:hypothetical protein